MISLDDALQHLQSAPRPVPAETVALDAASGRVLAAPVSALLTQPPFDASAMDGYAVRSADLTGDEVSLSVVAESAAGRASDRRLGRKECIRISTGAVMPPGADQVVIQENCTRTRNEILTSQSREPGKHIRLAGTDFHRGEVLLSAGTRLTPTALSLAVSGGIDNFVVRKRPQVGILSTGDELVEAGQVVGTGQIINSLGPGLSLQVARWGGTPEYLGIARDDPDHVRAKMASASSLDLFVTIGGASVGDHDHMRRVFDDMGGHVQFAKIAIKPGKPTWFGRLGATWVLGLPGNPVSAMVMAQLCLKPLLDGLLGQVTGPLFRPGVLASELPANGTRETMVRARHDPQTGRISPVRNQDSSALSGLVAANALIRRPAHADAALAGETVAYLPLDCD